MGAVRIDAERLRSWRRTADSAPVPATAPRNAEAGALTLPSSGRRAQPRMYTGRDVYRLLVQEGGWSADEYEEWLTETLVGALVER